MTDINTLLRINIEIEGLLRVLIDRDSIDARSLLADKFRHYSEALQDYLGERAPSRAETEAIADAGRELAAEAHAAEVKDQEAVEPEEEPETEAAVAAIEEETAEDEAAEAPVEEAEEPEAGAEEETAAEEKAPEEKAPEHLSLFTAFTLNDKFRFRRELFNGDIEDFADTIALLAHMPSYEEAVDYLTNDLLWDKRNPVVEEFFEILKKNMPS